MKSTWQLQDAKNRFSEVVNLAMTEGEQTITRHGKPVVVISAVASKADGRRAKGKKKETLVEILRSCPEPNFWKLIERTPGKSKDIEL